jgi:DNA gyrase subunit A
MLALVAGEPRILPLKRALQVYIEHRREVITRRTQFELDKAGRRAHILEGLLVALSNLDSVIQTIRESPDADVARDQLMNRFKLTEVQAQAILDMQLRRLAALERQKIEEEYAQLLETITYLEDLLANPHKILALIKEDVLDVKEKYGDERRTRVVADASEDFDEEDLVPREEVLIAITQRGYAKRVPATTYRTQLRGGRGVTGMTTREEDAVQFLFAVNSLDTILYFTDKGKVYSEKAYRVPDAGRTAKGIPIINLINLSPEERVTATVTVPDFEKAEYLTMVTRGGKIKRTDLSEFESVRPSGLIAITLDDGDELGWVKPTEGDDEVVLVTQRGQAIRFKESEVRSMGRPAAGVKAIRLAKGDHVAAMDVVEPDGDLLVVTAKGYAKRTRLGEYSTQGRYGGGVLTLSKQGLSVTGTIVDARVVSEDNDITLISGEGMVLRTRVKQIPIMGRATRGATVMRMREGDAVVSLALLAPKKKKTVKQPSPATNGADGRDPGKSGN